MRKPITWPEHKYLSIYDIEKKYHEDKVPLKCLLDSVDEAKNYIKELEKDRERLVWLVINEARILRADNLWNFYDPFGDVIVWQREDWREAFDEVIRES